IRFCSSRPFRPGREISSSRQLGTRARGRSRKSCAEANVSACQPSSCIKVSSDSRTQTSSSTTNTMCLALAIGDDATSQPSLSAKFFAKVSDRRRRFNKAECVEGARSFFRSVAALLALALTSLSPQDLQGQVPHSQLQAKHCR